MFNRRRAIVALFASTPLVLLSLAFAQPSYADTPFFGPWVIQNTASNLCVQPDPSNPGPDIQLVQESCGNADVLWRFVPLDNSGNY